MFEIYACPEGSKVNFAACTLVVRDLSWLNAHVKSLALPVANSMCWEHLKIMMLEEYCLMGEVQKLDQELWNLTMTGSNIVAYTTRFSDVAVLCPGMVTPESKKVER